MKIQIACLHIIETLKAERLVLNISFFCIYFLTIIFFIAAGHVTIRIIEPIKNLYSPNLIKAFQLNGERREMNFCVPNTLK